MNPQIPEVASGRKRAELMLAAVLLISVGTIVAASTALPAGASSAATVQQKKPKPTATTSPATSVSPTSTSTATPTPTQPTTTDTAAATVSQSTSSAPAPTSTASPSPGPETACTSETAVAFEGAEYCPGLIVAVQSGAYGVPSRVVLQGVTVVDVSGPTVYIMGGPACMPDPASQEPQYCGAMVAGVAVDFPEAESLPTSGTGIDLYGVTGPGGSLTPEGFVTVAWCDPDTCP